MVYCQNIVYIKVNHNNGPPAQNTEIFYGLVYDNYRYKTQYVKWTVGPESKVKKRKERGVKYYKKYIIVHSF